MGSLGLFTGVPQYRNFSSLHLTQSVGLMAPAPQPFEFPTDESITLPETYDVEGTTRSLQSLIDDTHTSALLVFKDGVVRFEQYFRTGGRRIPWISMSAAKSFVSALVGIAAEEKFIESLETPIDRYVPLLARSAYGGVRIKDVLQMSSGARWNEDYSDPDSDIIRMGSALGPGGSVDVFMGDMVRESAPGTMCRYNSADTQALGMLLAAATGRTLTDYMHKKLVVPLGMESPSYWLLDS
jgi:CubicO group peptidase (beta-lactamase class C family)